MCTSGFIITSKAKAKIFGKFLFLAPPDPLGLIHLKKLQFFKILVHYDVAVMWRHLLTQGCDHLFHGAKKHTL